jgi:hypothetical protein
VDRQREHLRLEPVEVVAENFINKIGLGDLGPIGCPFGEFLVVVFNDDLFVIARKCPRADMAVQSASSACVTLDVVALLTEWLPIAQVIGATSGAGNFVVGAQFYVRLLRPARGTFVPVQLLKLLPFFSAKLRSRLPFLANIQALQLIAVAFFGDRCKAFFALQFPHAPENVFIGFFSNCVAKSIDSGANVVFRQHRAGNTVPCWPERVQDDRVVKLVHRSCSNKASVGLSEPLLSTSLRFVRNRSWGKKESFTGTSLSHYGAGV